MKGIHKMRISAEKRRFLKKELKEYERYTPMKEEEKEALHEWVTAGNSVHENTAMAVYENGRSMDFLDVYREDEEIRRVLNSMSYEEGSKYLLEEYGINRDGELPPPPPTYEELLEKAKRLDRMCQLYWEVLAAHGLHDKADEYVRDHINEEWPFGSFSCDIAQ